MKTVVPDSDYCELLPMSLGSSEHVLDDIWLRFKRIRRIPDPMELAHDDRSKLLDGNQRQVLFSVIENIFEQKILPSVKI